MNRSEKIQNLHDQLDDAQHARNTAIINDDAAGRAAADERMYQLGRELAEAVRQRADVLEQLDSALTATQTIENMIRRITARTGADEHTARVNFDAYAESYLRRYAGGPAATVGELHPSDLRAIAAEVISDLTE